MDFEELTPEEKDYYLLESCKEKADKMSRRLEKLHEDFDELSGIDYVLSVADQYGLDIAGRDLSQKADAVRDALVKVRYDLFLLYTDYVKPDFYRQFLTIYQAMDTEEFKKYFSVFDVKSTVIDQSILAIKMPLLMSRYSYSKVVKRKHVPVDYLAWMVYELKHSLDKSVDDFVTPPKKNFAYLHSIAPGKLKFTDNDNYDTKRITDEVISFIGGTDSSVTTSMSAYSIFDGSLPEGSYLVVTDDFNSPPSCEKLVSILHHAFVA